MIIKPVVIFAWNGSDIEFHHINWNGIPTFDVILFNYSGNGKQPLLTDNCKYDELLNIKTEFKGSLINEVYKHFANNQHINYVGFIDDDLAISISGINQLFEVAHQEKLDAFQPATTKESFISHHFTIQQSDTVFELVDWVEIMCPFYRKELFDAAAEFYATCISSYGIDNYAIPYFQKIVGLNKTAVIHAVPVTHLKPVTDGDKVFSNGLTAREEGEIIRTEILHRIKEDTRNLFDIPFLKRVYEYKTFRYNKFKRDIKRWIGLKAV
jgi:hypothetical protein